MHKAEKPHQGGQTFITLKTLEDIAANPMSFSPYSQTYTELRGILKEGEPLADFINVAIIGKKELDESQFKITFRDKRVLNTITTPGKSASIAFTDNLMIAASAMINRPNEIDDALYITEVGLLKQIGFIALFAPTRHHPLHVRIVPDTFNEQGDIPITYRKKLIELLLGKK